MVNLHYSWRTFAPLALLFSLITVLAAAKQFFVGAWELHAFMQDFMAFFFIILGAFKIYNLRAFADAYSMYDLIAQKSRSYAYAYPFIELALGISYLMRWWPQATNIVTLLLMLISALGVARALARQEQIQCACMGALFTIPMTYVTLLEDLLMAAMAAYILLI